LKDLEINFSKVSTTLNEIYEEGKRALGEGDFKEDAEVLDNIHSCDACECNTDDIRYVCLHCRSF
jgi:hypothetical protein